MSVPVRLRRPLVVLGVLVSLLMGVASIRAAAAWTAAGAPLAVKPPSVESLRADLATEQARSIVLLAHLDELSSGSADLSAALGAARDRIAADAVQAKALQDSLVAAKAKLAALEKSIRAARARTAVSAAAAPRAATASHEGSHTEEGDDD
jgi:hypothetical protein